MAAAVGAAREQAATATRKAVNEEWAAKIAAEDEATFLPNQLLIWGGAIGTLGLVGYSVFGVQVADKRRASVDCENDMFRGGGCTESQREALFKESDDRAVYADTAMVMAALGYGAAIVGAVMLIKGVETKEASASPSLVPGPGGAWLVGSF